MAIKYILLVNKQGQTRLSKYYDYQPAEKRVILEGEIIRKCLGRAETQNHKVVYRRYASLYFIVGVDADENELGVLEFIHLLVETIDKYFANVCELDIMFNLEKAHMIIDEAVMNGCIVETSQKHILAPITLLDSTINAKDP